MADILVAADEIAATKIVNSGEAALGTVGSGGSGSLGPFTANWTASAFFSGGAVDLIPSSTIRLANCELHYNLHLSFSLNLNSILPPLCLPQICVTIPFFGTLCSPQICIYWPVVTIPVSFPDVVLFTADFRLRSYPSGANWKVDIMSVGTPIVQTSASAAALLIAVGAAAAVVLISIPFIGLFLATAVVAITAAIGIAGFAGFLAPVVTAFVSGRTFVIYDQPRLLDVLPAAGPFDPAVKVFIEGIIAVIQHSDEDELVLQAEVFA